MTLTFRLILYWIRLSIDTNYGISVNFSEVVRRKKYYILVILSLC